MDQPDQDAQDPASSAQQHTATSFFPPPPGVYKRYTARNLALLAVLRSHTLAPDEQPWHTLDPQARIERQRSILDAHSRTRRAERRRKRRQELGLPDDGGEGFDEEEEGQDADDEVPDFDLLLELDRPKVEWIEEDGGYTVFGQHWPIPDVTPSLEELGIPTLLPVNGADRKEQLTTLLQSLLHTYRALTVDLLRPAQPYDVWVPAAPDPSLPATSVPAGDAGAGFWTQSTEAKDRLKHIQNVVINMQFLINELRPTQAKETLKLMMQMQLQRRRDETQVIRRRCAEIRRKLEEVKGSLAQE